MMFCKYWKFTITLLLTQQQFIDDNPIILEQWHQWFEQRIIKI